MTAWKLPLLLLLAGDCARRAVGEDYSYSLEFEISRIEVQTAARIRTLGDEFKTDLSKVFTACFDGSSSPVTAVSVQKIYYTKLIDGFTSNALEVQFTATSDAASKPTFQTSEFATTMISDHGITVKSARLDGDAIESTSFELEGGEEDGAADDTIDRPMSRQMSRIFAIVGIIFIGVLLIAGYLIDLKSAKSFSGGSKD